MRRTCPFSAALIATFLVLAAPGRRDHERLPRQRRAPVRRRAAVLRPGRGGLRRFDDPGGWFTCSGTLLSSTIVVTAGHCTFGVGLNGVSTTHDGADTDAAHGGVGGNDVWISFARGAELRHPPAELDVRAGPEPAALPGLEERAERQLRVASRHRDAASAVRRPRVLRPRRRRRQARRRVTLGGERPGSRPLNWLDRYRGTANKHVFETVGYGLERVDRQQGDRRRHPRMKSHPKLDSLKSHAAEHVHGHLEQRRDRRNLLR